jgi:hypothetical protein
MKIFVWLFLMIFQSSMGPGKSKCDIPSGTAQRCFTQQAWCKEYKK